MRAPHGRKKRRETAADCAPHMSEEESCVRHVFVVCFFFLEEGKSRPDTSQAANTKRPKHAFDLRKKKKVCCHRRTIDVGGALFPAGRKKTNQKTCEVLLSSRLTIFDFCSCSTTEIHVQVT